jgi:DUF1680 family protein
MHYLDSLITIVGKAQEKDGYLYTARTIDPLHVGGWAAGPERWVKENEKSHELYCAGHMYEGAAAHFMATGKRNFLNIALKNADLLVQTFGPGKRQLPPDMRWWKWAWCAYTASPGKKNTSTWPSFL